MKLVRVVFILVLLLAGAATGFVYSGIYPVGADVPHSQLTYKVLEMLRERSTARASADLEVPNLENPELLLSGAPDYNEMCASCHLQPGKLQSDMSMGLYPAPPNLSRFYGEEKDNHDDDDKTQAARRQFWIIKHGIKASGMPAWGINHEEDRIWVMVAFLQKLPDLTPVQYQILTARGDGEAGHH